MRSPSIVRSALAARLLLILSLISQGSFASNTTSVQDGDTLLAIADSAGIPVESLEAANPSAVATGLYVGKVINIPGNDESATGMIASNAASSPITAAAPTTFVTSASSPVSYQSGSSSVVLSVPVSDSSAAGSSPASTASLPSPPSTTPSVSVSASTSSNTSSPPSTNPSPSVSASSNTPAPSSTTPSPSSAPPSPSSAIPSAASTTSSPASATSSPASTPASSSSAPTTPPPSSSSAPTTPSPPQPASSTPNSPPAAVACQPSPTGKYIDGTHVQSETSSFCSKYAATTQMDVQANAGAVLSDDQQPKGGHNGNVNNEKGYNMTVTVVSNFAVDGATVQYPLGSANPDFNCTTILFDTWRDCE